MGVSVEQGGGKRKGVDVELNLVPFIDLLSVCILFLLMTAVWVQVSKMSAFSQPSGEATISHSEVSSINKAREERDYDILVRPGGIEIKDDNKSLGVYTSEQFELKLQQLQTQLGTKIPKVSLRAADDVVYEDVIYVLDTLFNHQWTQVTVGGL